MNIKRFTQVLLVCLGILYFSCLNNLSLTDPDETFYSLTAKEMINHGSLVTPIIFGQPQFEKPPLFYWALMGSFEMFGIAPWSARLVPAICGLLGIGMTFFFCRRVFSEEIALLSTMILGTSALYLALSKTVLTDIMLAVLMAAAFYSFFLWVLEAKQFWLTVFAVALGLAVLTKGPVAFIIVMLSCVIYLLWIRDLKLLKEFLLNRWIIVFLLVGVPWYLIIISKYGHAFVDEFFVRDNWLRIVLAEHPHMDRWYFYPMLMVLGMFPFSFDLMFLGRRWKEFRRECLFLLVWIGVTFVVFQKAHSKLASYILPLIPAWAILLGVALSSSQLKTHRHKICALLYAILGVGGLFLPFFAKKISPEYVWPQAIIAVWLLAMAFLAAAFYLWRGNLYKAVILRSLGMFLFFLCAGFSIPAMIDRTVADSYVRKIVNEQYHSNGVIITSKQYARGVYFYTANPVVVIDQNKQPFWSSHPIDVISSYEEIKKFFQDKQKVLCVLRKNHKEDLDRIFLGSRNNRVLAQDGKKFVILSQKSE